MITAKQSLEYIEWEVKSLFSHDFYRFRAGWKVWAFSASGTVTRSPGACGGSGAEGQATTGLPGGGVEASDTSPDHPGARSVLSR